MSLEAIISGALASVMPSLYRSGTLHQVTQSYATNGDVTESVSTRSIKVQRDACTEAMKQNPGYDIRDVRLIILDFGGPLDNDDRVTDADGGEWRLATVDRAADNSHWVCRATPK